MYVPFTKKKCPTCGNDNKGHSRFCIDCGASLNDSTSRREYCVHCGAKIPEQDRFCGSCGEATSRVKATSQHAKSYGKLILIFVGVMVLLAFVMGQLSSSESSKNKRCDEILQEGIINSWANNTLAVQQLLVESVALGCD